MTWRVPPYDRALAELEAHIRTTYEPLGIVVSGSIVRGEGHAGSDLDVFVVHDQPWRLRDQRRFAGVPAELFVNPPAQVRRYFATEHDRGRPCTAHMFATGELLEPAAPVLRELVDEARAWLARPLDVAPAALDAQRYGAVDLLDDARDILPTDPAAARLLAASAVDAIIAHAFWRAGMFQPRRKAAVAALARLDPPAAALVERWAAAPSAAEALAAAAALARHVAGADTFFDWTSPRDPVAR